MSATLNKKPITQQHRDLAKAPSIDSQLPIQYQNGNTLSDWGGYCLGCDEPIPSDRLRGNIVMQTPSVATIRAVGICHKCKLLTPFNVRVRDNLSMEWQDDSGQWMVHDTNGTRPMGSPEPQPQKTQTKISLAEIICISTITAIIFLAIAK